MERIEIHEIPGFSFGQVQDLQAGTGCTVILCPEGAATGVDVRGGSPGTRDTDALDPVCNREFVHAVVLTGGSAFGMDAAGGVMKKLEEEKIGRDVMVTVVPNVCAAVLFDLKFGDHSVRPDPAMGYAACEKALKGEPFQEGNFGAGTGCTVGKIRGPQFAMKGGIGACAFRQGDLMVGAVVACNAMGDVLERGEILAGARNDTDTGFSGSEDWLIENGRRQKDIFSGKFVGENTVIGCVVTNAALNKNQANKLAAVAQNGLARAVRPANATFDGDTVFAMCHGEVPADPDAVGSMAARAVEEAIIRSVKMAESLHGRVALRDLPFGKKGV
ncbi:MAG: P1 family peptidase [Ruminiclostridium sp.]|nr:P1 family peptidase [Ruminiclostridium sp.]